MGKMVLLALALGALTQPSWSADDLMASQLVDQAREWQQKDRDDLAAELWRKLLRANPKHPEALVQLGAIEARAGNLREAEELHSRATRLPKPPAGLSQLSAAIGAAKGKPGGVALPIPLPKPKPEPSKPAPPKPEAPKLAPPKPEPRKPVPAKPVEPAAKTPPDKPVAPKAAAPSVVASGQKAQTPAASAPPKAGVNEKPAHKAEASTLNLKFSESIELVR